MVKKINFCVNVFLCVSKKGVLSRVDSEANKKKRVMVLKYICLYELI